MYLVSYVLNPEDFKNIRMKDLLLWEQSSYVDYIWDPFGRFLAFILGKMNEQEVLLFV